MVTINIKSKTMSNPKKTRKEILALEASLEELERAQPYLVSDYYYRRKTQLLEKIEKLKDKLENNEIAPDIQYIVTGDEE